MSKVIAVAGKGGTGKTTLSSLIIRALSQRGETPILGVDADPNSNLAETLGFQVDKTVGDIREDFMKDPQGIPSGMDKTNYLELLVNRIIIESKGFDLLVMGRQEGQGCYCMVNNILNRFTENLSKEYKYLIVDNEAGMEHLSRRTSGKVDHMLLVTDHSLRGLRALKRIHELIPSLKLIVENKGIVVTRAPETLEPAFLSEVEKIGLPIYGKIPDDGELLKYDMNCQSLLALQDHSLSVRAVDEMLSQMI